jgi:hypothetical protein
LTFWFFFVKKKELGNIKRYAKQKTNRQSRFNGVFDLVIAKLSISIDRQ